MSAQTTSGLQLPEGAVTIDVNGYPIAYVARGTGRSVVFVHGSLGDFRYWTPQFASLSDSFRIVALSLRHSFPERWNGTGGGFSIEQHALDVSAFIERIGPPVDLVGFSRGGVVAVEVARSRPELLRSLVLIEAGLDSLLSADSGSNSDPVPRLASEAIHRFESGDLEAGLRHFLDFAVGPGTWDKRPEALKQRMRENAWTLAGQATERRPNLCCADLQRLAMPILLFVGENSTARNKEITAAMTRCLPGAKIVTVAGAAHTMSASHPVEFNRALSAFLALPGAS